MGYLNIDNLYRAQDVLLFKEVYALEKIHGTSAHVAWKDGMIRFFAGGCKHDLFVSLFNKDDLFAKFTALGHAEVIVFGEQYGGKQQGMSKRYGKEAKFVAFDVKVGASWLSVPDAHDVATALGIEFVHYVKVQSTVAALDVERDAPSVQAKRNGILDDQPREGIVIRPLIELTKNNGGRVIAKYKPAEERETKTQREVTPEALEVLSAAEEIAREWTTPMRLTHVLDHLKARGVDISGMESTKEVIREMTEDILREGAGEIVDSKEARAAIGKATARLLKQRLQEALKEA
jgi:hypothetical protein